MRNDIVCVDNEAHGSKQQGNVTETLVCVEQHVRLEHPHHYKFLGSVTDQYKQVGNAVPGKMAKAVARALSESLRFVYDEETTIQPEVGSEPVSSTGGDMTEFDSSREDGMTMEEPDSAKEDGKHGTASESTAPGSVDLNIGNDVLHDDKARAPSIQDVAIGGVAQSERVAHDESHANGETKDGESSDEIGMAVAI